MSQERSHSPVSREPSPTPQHSFDQPNSDQPPQTHAEERDFSSSDESEPNPLPQSQQKTKQRRRDRHNRRDLPDPDSEQVDDSQALERRGNQRATLATPSERLGVQPEGGQGTDKDTLKLRLDLNLDVDIRITASVHGDVTLSLL